MVYDLQNVQRQCRFASSGHRIKDLRFGSGRVTGQKSGPGSISATHLGELKFALGAALCAVTSRQLVEYGPTASTLVLVGVFRLVVGVFVGFPVVVGHAVPPSPAAGTCHLVCVTVLVGNVT